MESKLNKIKILRDQLGITLLEANELTNQFSNVDDMIRFWMGRQDEETLTKLKERKEHFDHYGHNLDFLTEEQKGKISFMSSDFSKKVWSDHFDVSGYQDEIDSYEKYKLKSIHTENVTGNEFYDSFSKGIQSMLDWEKNALVYYFNGSSNCTKSEWGIICEHWIPSIYEGNYNLITNPESEKFLISIEYETYVGEKKQNLTLYNKT